MSSDDTLLRELGDLVRRSERDPQSTRLEMHSKGALPQAELNEFEIHADDDPALADALRAHAPLSDAVKSRIASALIEQSRGASSIRALAAAPPRPPGVRTAWVAGPLVAMAAAVALWIGLSSRDPALPQFALEVGRGQSAERSAGPSAAGAPLRVTETTRPELVLRPSTASEAPASAAAFLIRADGAAVRWPGELSRAPSGAMRLVLGAPPPELVGSGTLRVLVGAPEPLEERGAELAREPEARGGLQRFDVTVERSRTP